MGQTSNPHKPGTPGRWPAEGLPSWAGLDSRAVHRAPPLLVDFTPAPPAKTPWSLTSVLRRRFPQASPIPRTQVVIAGVVIVAAILACLALMGFGVGALWALATPRYP